MTLLGQDIITPVATSSSKQASKHIGWAVKVHTSYELCTNFGAGPWKTIKDYQWIEGKTKAATLTNAITEKTKQLAIAGTVSCWIESEMYPVTKPLR